MERRHLIAQGEGVFGVPEVCRILRPSMTPRKVHYWLDTGLIQGVSVVRGSRGHPTLLTFRQLLEIRTVQHLRDDIAVPLQEVRDAYAWILATMFDNGHEVLFSRGQGGRLIASTSDMSDEVVLTGQTALPQVKTLNREMALSRKAWVDQRLQISRHVVADPRIVAGAPTVLGTRIETAFVAAFAENGSYDARTLAAVQRAYPRLSDAAVRDAFAFEGILLTG